MMGGLNGSRDLPCDGDTPDELSSVPDVESDEGRCDPCRKPNSAGGNG